MDIISAIKNIDINSVKKILTDNPNDIEKCDENGVYAPFLAAKTGSLELVKYIIEYSRASMDVVDDKNRTILFYALEHDNVELVKYLVEKIGMSIFHGDINLITPYEEADLKGDKKILEYFNYISDSNLSDMYKNPILTGTFPDPSIVRVKDDYYMVNSSFIYFPCIPISHSKDLIHWHIIGHAITNPDYALLDDLEGGRGYWAPDISYIDEKFFITATYRLNDNGNIYRKQMVTSSINPEGPYCKPIFIDEDGIDPSIFVDDDNRKYMLLNRGARIFELSDDCTKKISEPEMLWYGDNKHAPEGAHLLKKNKYYYIFLAEGGTGIGHRISVARSKNLKGPYESCLYNPIMRQKDKNAIIQRAGHGKPVETQNGEWYMVYLCGRAVESKYSILGRETALDPIRWTDDEWPIVNELKGPSVLQKKPRLKEHLWEENLFDDFNFDTLNNEWMFPRAPKSDVYSISNSCLNLKGSKYDLNDIKCRSIIVKRQKYFSFACKTKVYIKDLKENQEIGMTCYYDENTYIKFYICGHEDKYSINIKEWIKDKYYEKEHVDIPKIKEVELKIDTNYLERSFFYKYESNKWLRAAYLNNVYYLCDEGIKKGKRFTGAMIGLYAYCGKRQCDTTIGRFDNFEIIKI